MELTSKFNNKTSFPPRIPPTPIKSSAWFPENLIEICEFILNSNDKKMKKPSFVFEMSQNAAMKNWSIVEKNNKNFSKALDCEMDTQLAYGSEFKDVKLLEMIFKNHPLWPKMKIHLSSGSSYPLTNLDPEKQKEDLIEALDFGNHKGVDKHDELFNEIMEEEVRRGWVLPIPRQKVLEIDRAIMAPMNIASQFGINEKGKIIEKKRLTHNQSMVHSSETSIDSRVIDSEIQDVMYGKCIIRVIHDIVSRRRDNPNKRIFIQKIDYKSAYRRGHLSGKAAIQTITQCVKRNLAFISLRLTFGGSPNPSFWGDIAEPVTDLANAIMSSKNWNPKTLHSPLQPLVPEREKNEDKSTFAQALPLAVSIEKQTFPKADIYIDDSTTVTVESEDNCLRAERAVLLAIEIVGRREDKNDPIPRNHLVSLSKLKAEAALEEKKVLLGWLLDTRKLLVCFPSEKSIAWSKMVDDIIKRGKSNHDELDSLIGRLTHISVILQPSKHFLSRLRFERKRAKNRRSIKLRKDAIEDLHLHKRFLLVAKSGISMNLLTYRKPTHIYRSDACPFGLGGYSATGQAWRWYIPKILRFRATINMLEHLAAVICPWVDLIENNLPHYSCILAMTDSTTAAGWLRKSNFQYNEDESK